MFLASERGFLIEILIDSAACISGACLIYLFAPALSSNYVAYGLAGTLCVYLASRYVIDSMGMIEEGKMLASAAMYVGAGIFSAAFSLLGVFETIDSGRLSGTAFVSFVVLGGELGSYRKILLCRKKQRIS